MLPAACAVALMGAYLNVLTNHDLPRFKDSRSNTISF
jgi:hypothetical protein